MIANSDTKSGRCAVQPRDEKILQHIGRYRLTLRPVLDRVFFAADSSGCGNVLARLIREGFVRSRPGLARKRCYYQLTRFGAEGRVPLARTAEVRGQALRSSLAILWFCCMSAQKRVRLERHELERVFPAPPSGPHCAEPGKQNRIYRVRVVSPKTQLPHLVRSLRHFIQKVHEHPESKAVTWIRTRNYGIAVLVERERLQRTEEAIRRAKLTDYVRIIVEAVPGPQTIRSYLNDN